MKFPPEDGIIERVRVHQKTARECYAASLRILPRSVLRMKEVNSIVENEKTTPLQIGKPELRTRINANLKGEDQQKITKDVFAWTTADMPGIAPQVMSYKLVICRDAKSIIQKKLRLGEERRLAAQAEVCMQAKGGRDHTGDAVYHMAS